MNILVKILLTQGVKNFFFDQFGCKKVDLRTFSIILLGFVKEVFGHCFGKGLFFLFPALKFDKCYPKL